MVSEVCMDGFCFLPFVKTDALVGFVCILRNVRVTGYKLHCHAFLVVHIAFQRTFSIEFVTFQEHCGFILFWVYVLF